MSDAFEVASIPFVKASACGNDFLIIEGERAIEDIAAFTRRVCDRRRGVGADGVEWIYPASDADIEARLVNADGSAAEISGNGTRCVAAYLASQKKKEKFVIRTGAGLKTCVLTGRNGNLYEFETAMGLPVVEEELSLVLNRGVVRGIPVSMGNPHYVVFVDEILPDWMAEAVGNRTSSPFQARRERGSSGDRRCEHDRCAVLRTWGRRDALVGNRLVRVGGGGDRDTGGEVSGSGASAGRSADGAVGAGNFFARTRRTRLPRRVLVR